MMLTLQEYCKRVKMDAYGGSCELVDDGILALCNEIKARRADFADARALCGYIEESVESILASASAILPLINLLDACMRFVEEYEDKALSAKETADAALALLSARKAAQDSSLDIIGEIGARMIPDGAKISTFSTSGSVMSILEKAKKSGKSMTATAHEARPHNEGYRTMKEIAAMGIPVTFGVDALLCALVPKSDLFIIGADAIRATGEVFAKTGSYQAALVSKYFGIPFYVAADTSKFDSMSLLGYPLRDSARPSEEVSEECAPENATIVNISFELIPPELVTGIITEKGLVTPYSVATMMEPEKMSKRMMQKLAKWIG